MQLVLIFALIAAAIILWSVLSIPYLEMKVYVDSLSPDGKAESFDQARYAAARFKGKFVAAGLFLSAVFLAFSSRRKKKPKQGFSGLVQDMRKGWKEIIKRSSSAHLWTVLVLVLLGTGLRAYMLTLPIMYDEAFTFTQYATKPIWVIMSDYSYPNNHIFHTLLVKISTTLFGVGEVQMRLPAFFAGVLCMPIFYLFIRSLFNRYIALTVLGLVAASGGLVEYSALGRGYSITWLCMIIGFMLARHFIRSNNSVSAFLLGLVLAIGMWAVPTMVYPAIGVYIFILLLLISKYETTLQERMQKFILSLVVFVLGTALFYSPVVIMNSVDQLFYHPTMGDNSWDGLVTSGYEMFTNILFYWAYSTTTVISFISIAGVVFAGFISSKFRILLFSMLLGILPLLMIQSVVGPPRVWNFVQFIYCTGVGIAIFYLLKFVQENLFPKLSKRVRTIVGSLIVFALFAFLTVESVPARADYYRYFEAERLVTTTQLLEGDQHVLVDFPWEAPLEFQMIANDKDLGALYRDKKAGDELYLLVAPAKDQTTGSVLEHYGLLPEAVQLDEELYFSGKQVEVYRGTIK